MLSSPIVRPCPAKAAPVPWLPPRPNSPVLPPPPLAPPPPPEPPPPPPVAGSLAGSRSQPLLNQLPRCSPWPPPLHSDRALPSVYVCVYACVWPLSPTGNVSRLRGSAVHTGTADDVTCGAAYSGQGWGGPWRGKGPIDREALGSVLISRTTTTRGRLRRKEPLAIAGRAAAARCRLQLPNAEFRILLDTLKNNCSPRGRLAVADGQRRRAAHDVSRSFQSTNRTRYTIMRCNNFTRRAAGCS